MFCNNCGAHVLDSYNYCPECGQKIEKMNNNMNVNPLALFVLVSLLNGGTKQLYFFNNMYFSDKECRNVFPMNLIANPFNHQVLDENNGPIMFMGIGNFNK